MGNGASGKSAHMLRFFSALASRQYNSFQIIMCWPVCYYHGDSLNYQTVKSVYTCMSYENILKGRCWRRQTGLSPPVKYFTDRLKAVLLLWIINVFSCLVFVMPLCASVCLCFVVTSWETTDLLALVCGV